MCFLRCHSNYMSKMDVWTVFLRASDNFYIITTLRENVSIYEESYPNKFCSNPKICGI